MTENTSSEEAAPVKAARKAPAKKAARKAAKPRAAEPAAAKSTTTKPATAPPAVVKPITEQADVIVVGAGPGGSSAAYHLAVNDLNVLLLEKTEFPREKVCGDGLTPRAVTQLHSMGIKTEGDGWVRNKGLRLIGGGTRTELDWPSTSAHPNYGLTRTRHDFDEILAQQAVAAGAQLHINTTVTEALTDVAGRVVGVKATVGPEKTPAEFRAPIVIAADGVSSRFALSLGLAKRDDRPMGVAVRRYYRSPVRTDDDYLEAWFDVRNEAGDRMPGYGWIFGLGDGRVNVGLGALNANTEDSDYRRMLTDWLATTPKEWGLTEENADGPIRGAALPMGFNRVPHYTRGVLLVGDSGGMVNPFNGEGIAYAMEAGQLAAQVAEEALVRTTTAGQERVLRYYPKLLRARFGGYYRLGNVFAKAIGNPTLMRLGVEHVFPRPALMRLAQKLMANLYDPESADPQDRLLTAITRLTPAV